MPEKKKQHFIPKLLLRNFSNDTERKLINVYNPDTNFYRKNCSIKTQGQEDFFYGEDLFFENKLGSLENATAPVISNIISNIEIPIRDSENYGLLFFFSLLLSHRTNYAANRINEMVNKTFQEAAKHDDKISKIINEEKFKLGFKNPAAAVLETVSEAILGAYDLELKLLDNQSSKKFIISDHPSVRYNQYLEKRKHPGGHLGLFTKGLQIFLPISPDKMLVFFDKWAYKIGNKKDIVVKVSNEKDIDSLNYLQIVNCDKTIFSNNSIAEHYLSEFGIRAKKIRSKELISMKEINKRYIDKDGQEHINYMTTLVIRNFNLQLSFIKEPQGAKSHKLNNYVAQVRNENMRNYNSPN